MISDLVDKNIMLYDGDCGFCMWSVEKLKKIDSKKIFIFKAYQEFSEEELLDYQLNLKKCSEAIQLISKKGKVHSGAFAINFFLFHYFPFNLLLVPIYPLPIFLLFEILVYRWIAKNRYRVSQWLGLKSCSISEH